MNDALSFSEAATMSGVSVRTIRRWVAVGQVRTVGTGRDRRIVADSLPVAAPVVDTEAAVSSEAVQLAAIVRDLSAKLAEQAAVSAMWQERARSLSDQLALAAPAQAIDEKPAVHTWRRWYVPLALVLAFAAGGVLAPVSWLR